MPREDDVMFLIGRIKITRRILFGFLFIPVFPTFVLVLYSFDITRALSAPSGGKAWLLLYGFPAALIILTIFYLFYDNMIKGNDDGDK